MSSEIVFYEAGIFHLIVEPELNLYNGLFLLSLPSMAPVHLLSRCSGSSKEHDITGLALHTVTVPT